MISLSNGQGHFIVSAKLMNNYTKDHIFVLWRKIWRHDRSSFSAVQIYDLSYIHLHSSPSPGILQTHNVTRWLMIAQLVEHYTSIAEVMG